MQLSLPYARGPKKSTSETADRREATMAALHTRDAAGRTAWKLKHLLLLVVVSIAFTLALIAVLPGKASNSNQSWYKVIMDAANWQTVGQEEASTDTSSSSADDPAADTRMPWESSSNPWSGLENDITALLHQRGVGSSVSVTILTAERKQLTVNYVFALETFGSNREYIVAAFDKSSVEACMELKLPCWNAAPLLQDYKYPGTWNSDSAEALAWGKVFATTALLQKGYNVHFGAADTVYLQSVHTSYTLATKKYSADVIAMDDAGNINTGNWFALSNARTVVTWTKWAALAGQAAWSTQQIQQSQLSNVSMCICKTATECAGCREKDSTAVWLHPSQLPATGDSSCSQQALANTLAQDGGLCAGHRMYVHASCALSLQEKVGVLKNLSVWFVDESAQGNHHLLTSAAAAHHDHQLPCERDVPSWALTQQ